MIISGNDGPIPSCLSECFVGTGSGGIGIGSHLLKGVRQKYSQGHTGKPRHVSPSNYVPIRDAVDRAKPEVLPKEYGPRLRVQHTLDQELRHGAWAYGLASLGPYPVQKVRVRARTIRPGSKAQ